MKIGIYDLELDDNGMSILRKVRTEEAGDLYLYEDYNPNPYYKFLNKVFRIDRQAEEHLYLLAFDYYYNPVGAFDVTHGTYDEADWKPFNIYTRLSLCNGMYFIIAHNHPNASREDLLDINIVDYETTEKIINAGLLVKRKCIDHMIIGRNCFCSMAKETPVFVETEDCYEINH